MNMATYAKVKVKINGKWVYLRKDKPGDKRGANPKTTKEKKGADNFWDREVYYYEQAFPKLEFKFDLKG
jgi:hypothetical protein